MGVKYLLQLLVATVSSDVKGTLRDKDIGVDIYGWIHLALSVCAVDYVLGGNTAGIKNFLRQRLRSVCHLAKSVKLVFDGNSSPGKVVTEKLRHDPKKRAEWEKELQKLADLSANGYQSDKKKIEQLCNQLANTIPRDLFDEIWQDLLTLQLEQGTNCKFSMLVAPREADHQLTFMVMKKIINSIVAGDTDMVIHQNPEVVVDYKYSQANGYTGRVFSLPKVTALAANLASMKDDTERTKHLESLTPTKKHVKIPLALQLYTAINSRGLCALREFAQLVGNDYCPNGVPGVDEVTALKILNDPDGSLMERTMRQKPRLTETSLCDILGKPEWCFLHGTVVDDENNEQRSLSGLDIPNTANARKKILGLLELNPQIVHARAHNQNGARYTRFKLATMFHPAIAESKGLSLLDVDSMQLNKAKLQLQARGVVMPKTEDLVRGLLRKVVQVEKQKDYGPPRIYYPNLLKPDAKFVDFEFPDSDDETVGKRKKNNGSKTWGGLGKGDETDGWVSDPDEVSIFTPQVTPMTYLHWFQRLWRADMSEDSQRFTRPLTKGSQNTANRDVQVQYKDNGDGTCCLRCKLLHSFPSKSKNSEHYGFLHPAVHLKVETNNEGYPVATEVLDGYCDCTSQGSKSCWHLGGLLKSAEHLVRGEESRIPMSTTAKLKSFNQPSETREVLFDTKKPLCALPTRNNNPRNTDRVLSAERGERLSGKATRFAVREFRYCSVPLTPDNFPLRNHPEIIKCRAKLYSTLVSGGHSMSAAEVHWPATEMPVGAYSWLTPISEAEYLQTGRISRFNFDTAIHVAAPSSVGSVS